MRFLILKNKKVQGLIFGIFFGFLLQKGGVTQYDVMVGQLLLEDFTVMKVMLTAVLVGMWGIYYLRKKNLVEYHLKPFSVGSTVIGAIIFGIGMGILGYCPGTVSGAAAQGNLDALIGGIGGILAGSCIFSNIFPFLNKTILHKGEMGKVRIPELLNIKEGFAVLSVSVLIIISFICFELYGL
ncbi:MAG: YeeE/YedE family protein [Desulfamplus sp.]|nr:YeeE/YedE family protein [Desulfamplus sp.]